MPKSAKNEMFYFLLTEETILLLNQKLDLVWDLYPENVKDIKVFTGARGKGIRILVKKKTSRIKVVPPAPPD